jgi:membrane protein
MGSDQESGQGQSPEQADGWPRDWPGRFRRSWDVCYHSVWDTMTDNLSQWAAAVAYFSLVSVFPLLLAVVVIASFFVEPQWAVQHLTAMLGDVIPEGEELIEGVVQGVVDGRVPAGFLSVALWLWTGSRVFGVMTMALNVAFDVERHYSFWQRLIVELAMTVSVGVLLAAAFLSALLLPVVWNWIPAFAEEAGFLLQLARWVVPVVLLFTAFLVTYQWVPRTRTYWRASLVGAGVATALFLAARPLFVMYLQHFGDFEVIYGSVGLVVILVIWAWVVALITLFGGELAAHVQMMVIEGLSADEVHRRHEARSPASKSGGRSRHDEEEASWHGDGEAAGERPRPRQRV